MGVCDICYKPGMGTRISADQVREAVFDAGFDPFELGLVPMGPHSPAYVENWKKTVVAVDGSDWNLCSGCFEAINPHFTGAPAPTGRTQGMDPVMEMMLAPLQQAMVKQKQRKEDADNMVGCLGTIAMIAAGVGISYLTGWGFWASAGTVVGGLFVLAIAIAALQGATKPARA